MNRRSLVSVVLAALALLPVASVRAQMIEEEPRPVRVTRDQAEVRCGWGSETWYSVGRAPAGTELIVDGREGDWLRVRYPDDLGFGVLLRAGEVEIDEDAGTATLTRAARPIHRNRQSPATGSWMKLTGEPFAAGTEFELIDTVSDAGAVEFVLVEAPARVRGYVKASDVEAIERASTPATDDAPAEQGEQEQTTPSVPAEDDSADDEQDTGPQQAPAHQTGDAAAADGEDENAPEEPKTATPDQLYAAYDAVVREPIEGAELEPLLEEFRGAIASTEDEDVRNRLNARLSLLQIRLDLQRDLRAVSNAADRAARERETIDRLVGDWRSRPTYHVVGRLMASTLYDGRRLPLMYRLQSLDGPGGRTIAYILPSEELDLDAKLGGVVGVVGEARRDRTIRVRMIEPTQVDVLEPGN